MSSFSTHWLALREPLDASSRAARLVGLLREALGDRPSQHARAEIIDLGAGTGANLRYAAPLLAGAQDWLLVERDPLLLAATRQQIRAWSRSTQCHFTASGAQLAVQGERFECRVRSLALDLAVQLDRLPLHRGVLLTASALLDLVSEPWLRMLMRRAAAVGAAVWFTLTYDGRIDCDPVEAEDQAVRELVNQHQRSDKGFGLALGPGAASTAAEILGEHGYRVHCAPSDWCLGADHAALQYALVEGWFEAACEIAPTRTGMLRAWRKLRRAHIDDGRSSLRVGHVDMVGRPG
ncbi:MAG TPA: hypothetical protein VIY90_19490 [Steroidobacteraceae bacterium]